VGEAADLHSEANLSSGMLDTLVGEAADLHTEANLPSGMLDILVGEADLHTEANLPSGMLDTLVVEADLHTEANLPSGIRSQVYGLSLSISSHRKRIVLYRAIVHVWSSVVFTAHSVTCKYR
jgi:hypothetical protein